MKIETVFVVSFIQMLTTASASPTVYLRSLAPTHGNTFPCEFQNATTCICSAPCLTPNIENTSCHPKDCYSYDKNLARCSRTGYSKTVALILQIFLGGVGAGFGYIHNWLYFAIPWIIIGGTVILACGCIVCCGDTRYDSESESRHVGAQCTGILATFAILGFYIFGIVAIASNNPGITGDGCPMI